MRVLLFKNYLLLKTIFQAWCSRLRVLLFKNYLLQYKDKSYSTYGLRVLLFKNYLLPRTLSVLDSDVWEYCYSRIIFYTKFLSRKYRRVWEYCYSRIIFYDVSVVTFPAYVWEYCYSRIIFYPLAVRLKSLWFESIVIQELSSTESRWEKSFEGLRVLLFKNYLLPPSVISLRCWCLRVLLFKNYLLRENGYIVKVNGFESIVIQELSSTIQFLLKCPGLFESIVIQELSSTEVKNNGLH